MSLSLFIGIKCRNIQTHREKMYFKPCKEHYIVEVISLLNLNK